MERQGVADVALAKTYDPLIQARWYVDLLRETLRLQMFIGTSDQRLDWTREFESYLEDLSIPHQYAKLEGVEHNLAQYLRAVEPEAFEFFSAHLSVSGLPN